jgi:hypothetical protein
MLSKDFASSFHRKKIKICYVLISFDYFSTFASQNLVKINAEVAELVDALDSKSSGA